MKATWMSYAEMTGIDKDGGAISTVRTGSGLQVVRPTTDGRFAVLALDGPKAKVVKVLPTRERARAYNLACGR